MTSPEFSTCDLCDLHKNDRSGAFRVLPPTHLVGDFFYEATGILEFVVGAVAAYYAYRFLRAAIAQRSRATTAGEA